MKFFRHSLYPSAMFRSMGEGGRFTLAKGEIRGKIALCLKLPNLALVCLGCYLTSKAAELMAEVTGKDIEIMGGEGLGDAGEEF